MVGTNYTVRPVLCREVTIFSDLNAFSTIFIRIMVRMRRMNPE
jgi:hypothetical protein